MNKKIASYSLNTILYYLAYALAIFAWLFTNVDFVSNYLGKILNVSYIILIINFALVLREFTWRSLFIIITSIITTFISWQVSETSTIAILLLFIISAKNIKFDSIVKYDLYLKIIFGLIIITLYFKGATTNYIMYRSDGTIRSSMGFSHPNAFGTYVFSLGADIFYINRNKFKIRHFILFALLAVIVDYFSDSRTSVISLIIMIVAGILFKLNGEKVMKNKLICKIIPSIFIIFTVLSLILCYFYKVENPFAYRLDELFSGRIRLAVDFLENYNITLFGNKIEIVNTYYASLTGVRAKVLDNAYIKFLLQYGIVTYLVFALFVYSALQRAIYKKDYIYIVIFCIYIFMGLMSNILYQLYGNVFLLYFSKVVYFKKSYNKKLID